MPSSKVLCRRLVESADIASAKRIVELGPGTGGTTRAILEAMAPDARLLSIEGNRALFGLASRIRDERLSLHCGDALDLKNVISEYEFEAPDVVVAGIPFSTISRPARATLLETIGSSLMVGGRFVAYQVSKQILRMSPECLAPAAVQRHVLLSLPPLWVLRWDKVAGDPDELVH